MATAEAALEDADGGDSTEVRDEVGETNMTTEELVDFAKSEKAEAKYLYFKFVPSQQVYSFTTARSTTLQALSMLS